MSNRLQRLRSITRERALTTNTVLPYITFEAKLTGLLGEALGRRDGLKLATRVMGRDHDAGDRLEDPSAATGLLGRDMDLPVDGVPR